MSLEELYEFLKKESPVPEIKNLQANSLTANTLTAETLVAKTLATEPLIFDTNCTEIIPIVDINKIDK